jgi:DNA polymerase III subunit gamma/tau
VLIKAAAPEVDPSTAALLARIERLESALSGGPALASRPIPTPTPDPVPAPTLIRTPAPSAASEPAPPPQPLEPPEPAASAPANGAPAPAPAPTAPAPRVEPPELETVAACWPAVIEVVRQENQMLAALLADARPVSLAGEDVTIAFPAGKAFLKRKAEQDDYRRVTAEALRSVVGTALKLRYELRDEAELPSTDGLSQEELVKRLVEEFDAHEVLDDPDQEEAP